MYRIFFIGILVLMFGSFLYLLFGKKNITPTLQPVQTDNNKNITVTSSTPKSVSEIVEPIDDSLARVSKKLFGLKVSPTNSPVSPEKFAGYHTGVDFETIEAEQNIEVPIYAICSGKLLLKKQATGYGGVAVQSCVINKQAVTVVYGHLKLASIKAQVNQELAAGEQIGILGKGYSTETDGERKHLHLGIHLGQSIVLLGYVKKQTDLSNWLDPVIFFQK